MSEKQRYEADKIEQMFREDPEINEEFKGLIMSRINANFQAMYNCVTKKGDIHLSAPHGDFWIEEYNRFVTDYQKYHNQKKEKDMSETIKNKKDDTMGVLYDPLEWYRIMADKPVTSPWNCFVPEGVENYLSPVFTGYMTSPCAIYDGKNLAAKHETVKDIEEFRTRIANLGKPAFLYRVMYIPTQPLFRKLNEETGEVEQLDTPEIMEGGWKIGYAVAEE